MSFGKLLLGAAVLGGGAWLLGRHTSSTSQKKKPPTPSATYQVIDAYFGGAKPGDPGLPTIVVLHGEGSTPTMAFKTLEGKEMFANGWQSPVRILCPTGRFGVEVPGPARFYVEQGLATPASYQAAQRQEGERLATWLATAVAAYTSAPPRVIVVGLGANGPLAVEMAFQRPDLIRQAYGTGGSVPSYWVLDAAQLGDTPSPLIRKLSYGDGVGPDDATQKAAKERGYDFETMDLPAPPSEATVQKWLLPQIDDQLLVP